MRYNTEVLWHLLSLEKMGSPLRASCRIRDVSQHAPLYFQAFYWKSHSQIPAYIDIYYSVETHHMFRKLSKKGNKLLNKCHATLSISKTHGVN